MSSETDLAALSWDATHKLLWALYDSADKAYAFESELPISIDVASCVQWQLSNKYDVPGSGQEGMCMAVDSAQNVYLLLAQDRAERDKQLVRYEYDP